MSRKDSERSHFRWLEGENLRRKETNFTFFWITFSWLNISSCKSIFVTPGPGFFTASS